MKRPEYRIIANDPETAEMELNDLIDSLEDHEGYEIIEYKIIGTTSYNFSNAPLHDSMLVSMLIAIIDNS